MLKTSDLLKGIEGSRLAWPVARDTGFTGVVIDSRLASPGSLFVALQGARDGHDFIADAFARGCRGVIAERMIDGQEWLPASRQKSFSYVLTRNSLEALQNLAAHWRSHQRITTIGITGSVGKTTTKELVAHVLGRRYNVLRNEKNYNNEIGLPLTLLNLKPGHEAAVLEMGMYDIGEIATLCRLAQPTIGVVTNVGPTHLERLGTVDRIAQAKSELVQSLPKGGVAILNADDERVYRMRDLTQARVLTYGLRPKTDVQATDIVSHGLSGLSFTLHYQGEQHRIKSTLLGQHNALACLAAAAVGFELGLSGQEVALRLRRPPKQLRLSLVAGQNGSTIIDDTYNASPASVIAALELLSQLPGRRIAILGDMFELGAHEEIGHREVGRKAAMAVDAVITVGERARWIAEEASRGGLRDVRIVDKRDDVSVQLEPQDVVLVKGSRGMRMEEIVANLAKSQEK